MIDLTLLTPEGRKQWVKRQYDEYEASRLFIAIKKSHDVYYTPTDERFKDVIARGKWKSAVDRKVAYLLARPPICTGLQQELDTLSDLIKETAKELLLRGSVIWVVQGDDTPDQLKPRIMNNTIAVYEDENRDKTIAYIRKYSDVELDETTGTETEVLYYECYYKSEDTLYRDTFCYTKDTNDEIAKVIKAPLTFIQLNKTGDAPLFSYVEKLLEAYDNVLKHQNKSTEKNTDPLVEIRGYSGTEDDDLRYAVDERGIVLTDGNGAVTIHTRQMDATSQDLWAKRVLQEFYEATCTVGKENELVYAQSGKAMDRLFVDMENSARDMAHTLEQGLKEYFAFIGEGEVDIIWNTDRPIDDGTIIASIQASKGILSDKTLLENHPWVDNVDEELKRLEEQGAEGMEDLVDDEINFEEGEQE